MARQEEIRCLTGIRGLAALYVVVFHYVRTVQMTTPGRTVLAHGYLSVDLFFTLSGLVMAMNYAYMFKTGITWSSFKVFLGRRIARVYPLYLVATLCASAMIAFDVMTGPKHLFSGGVTLVANLFMVQLWGIGPSLDLPAWTISAEWAAYLVFPVLLFPALFRKPTTAVLLAIGSVAVLSVFCFLPSGISHRVSPTAILNITTPRYGLSLLRCLPEFVLGILAFRVASSTAGKAVGKSAVFSTIICLVLLTLLAVPRADLAIALLVPVLLVALVTGNHWPQRLLSSSPMMLAGKLSYSIYLIHDLLAGIVPWANQWVRIHGLAHPQSWATVFTIAVTIPIALVAYTFVEMPGRNLLRLLCERSKFTRVERVPSTETGMP